MEGAYSVRRAEGKGACAVRFRVPPVLPQAPSSTNAGSIAAKSAVL